MGKDIATERLLWPWPLQRVHAGIPLGNGTFGALLWGDGSRLRITINRQDYWDHQGGVEWTEEASFENLKRLLAEGNEAELRRIFEGRDPEAGDRPMRPTRLPMGRVDLDFGEASVDEGGLVMADGEAVLKLENLEVSGLVLRDRPVLCMRLCGKGADTAEVVPQPVDEQEVLGELRTRGYPEVERFKNGWVQARPEGADLVVAWRKVKRSRKCIEVFVCAVYGSRNDAEKLLDRVADAGYTQAQQKVAKWWKAYWKQAATVDVPSNTLRIR